MAFTSHTVPRIAKEVDFLNVMTYDLMNRRDNITKHHSGVADSREALQRYISRGVSDDKVNLGLGYYVKWFLTKDCNPKDPINCPTQLLEDPETGADLGKTGGFSWHDKTPEEVQESFARAQSLGSYDKDGSYFYWDAQESRWWTFDTSQSIQQKFDNVIAESNLGGIFAWGLGEDAPEFGHFKATVEAVNQIRKAKEARDEL